MTGAIQERRPPAPPRPARRVRRLLFVDHAPPADGAGTPVIMQRHLQRLAADGWQIEVAVPEWTLDADANGQPWTLVRMPRRRLWWPPHRQGRQVLDALRSWLLARDLTGRLAATPDVVLTVLSPEASRVAAAVARRLDRPLVVIAHDQIEWWEGLRGRPAGQHAARRAADQVLAQAASVLPVTDALADAYGDEVVGKSHLLLPVPADGAAAAPTWRAAFAAPHLVHSGSLHDHQVPNVRALAEALRRVGGRMTLATHHDHRPFEPIAREYANVTLRGPFASSNEALAFCAAEASVLLVSYAFVNQPWSATSFPSKLVEFARLGLPMLIVAPPTAAVSRWARDQRWTAHVETLDVDVLAREFAALSTRDGWARRAADTRGAAFDADAIHAVLAEQLEAHAYAPPT